MPGNLLKFPEPNERNLSETEKLMTGYGFALKDWRDVEKALNSDRKDQNLLVFLPNSRKDVIAKNQVKIFREISKLNSGVAPSFKWTGEPFGIFLLYFNTTA